MEWNDLRPSQGSKTPGRFAAALNAITTSGLFASSFSFRFKE